MGWLAHNVVALHVDQGGLTLPSEVVYQNSIYTNYVSGRPDCKNTSANCPNTYTKSVLVCVLGKLVCLTV